jgi:hypothetical protein
LAEWLYEEGIGENRAILVEDGGILAAAIELPGEMRCGSVLAGRLVQVAIPGRRGIVATERGEVMVEPLPAALTEGRKVRVEVVREPIAEPGHPKFAKGRITDSEEKEGLTLAERIGSPPPLARLGPDRFYQAGWSELIDEALGEPIDFPGGELRMSLTPAMTLFDVDGFLPPFELAVAGAAAAALAIRRHDIGGSIGIDLPTVSSREERLRVVAALDALLPRPFERTAVNGFGFLQVVRRRERRSLPELLQWDEAGAAARDLLRTAERGIGACELVAAPAVIARRVGGQVSLREDSSLTTWRGHVHFKPS